MTDKSISEVVFDPRTLDSIEIIHPITEITDKHYVMKRFPGMSHGMRGEPSFGIGKPVTKRLDRAKLEAGETVNQGRNRWFALSDRTPEYVGEHPENQYAGK